MLCLQLVALPPSGHKINKWHFNKKCKLLLPPSWSKIYSLVNVRADLPTLSPSPHTSAVLHSCWLWLVTKPFALLLLQEYLRSWDFKYQQIPALWKPCLVLSINAVNYSQLSQAWEEWMSRHWLARGLQFLTCGFKAAINTSVQCD